jgi:hypothetical protein
MIEAGYDSLKPFYEFRQWLSEIPRMRCHQRRNGSEGLWPFTLRARQLILESVRTLESTTKKRIIDSQEDTEIRRLWQADRISAAYRKIDGDVDRWGQPHNETLNDDGQRPPARQSTAIMP